jgi:hypothetical protein
LILKRKPSGTEHALRKQFDLQLDRQGIEEISRRLRNQGLSQEKQDAWVEMVLEECERNGKANVTNEFFSSETARSLALGSLFLIASGSTAVAQKNPAAKVSATSNSFTFGASMTGEALLKLRQKKQYSLDNGMLTRVMATFITAGVVTLINNYSEEMGLGEENTHRSLHAFFHAFLMATVIDFARTSYQRWSTGKSLIYNSANAIPPNKQEPAHFFTSTDFLVVQSVGLIQDWLRGRAEQTTAHVEGSSPLAGNQEISAPVESERTSETEVAVSSEPLDKTAAARVVQGALEEMGISPEEQIQLARAIVELAKKTSPQEANPFLSSETATSAALGILLVATTAIAASQQKDFAAKIPIMSGLFGFVQDPLARLIRAFRSEQSLRLDRSMYTKIIGTGITAAFAWLTNRYSEQMGLGKENPHPNLTVVGYAMMMSVTIDAIRNAILRATKGHDLYLLSDAIPLEKQVVENYVANIDLICVQLAGLVQQYLASRAEGAPAQLEGQVSEDEEALIEGVASQPGSRASSISPVLPVEDARPANR